MPDRNNNHDDLLGKGGAYGGPREPSEARAANPAFRRAVDALVAGQTSSAPKGYDEYHPEDPADRGWDLGM